MFSSLCDTCMTKSGAHHCIHSACERSGHQFWRDVKKRRICETHL